MTQSHPILAPLVRGLSALTAALLLVTACKTLVPAFKSVDAVCIAGRLSQAQADAINATPWEAGGRREPAKMNDRVLREECSECLKSFTLGGENRELCRLVLEALRE